MVWEPERDFSDFARDAKEQSDKALYPYLKVHIFGPFQDDCYAYLSELKFQLQDKGFESAAICDDRGNEPPPDAEPEEKMEFWWEESEEFLVTADVAIFVFLDYIFDRLNLPQRALDEAYDSGVEEPREINSSVVSELVYWLESVDESTSKTLVIFEEGAFDNMGSLIPGIVGFKGVDYEVIENEKIGEAVDEAHQRCMNWVMNEMRSELQDRDLEDRLDELG